MISRNAPRLAYVAGAELALSLLGGGLAVMFHVNTFADAYGNKAEMAMPCLLALLSTGDDETFKPGLPTWVYVYQVVIIAAAALGLIPAGMHLRSLWRRIPEPAASL